MCKGSEIKFKKNKYLNNNGSTANTFAEVRLGGSESGTTTFHNPWGESLIAKKQEVGVYRVVAFHESVQLDSLATTTFNLKGD